MQLVSEARPCGGGRGKTVRAEWLKRSIMPHEPWVRGQLRRLGVADQAIEDVIQDTYVRLLNANCIAHVRDCRRYFSQTARSVVLTQARRATCVIEATVGDDAYFSQLAAPDPGPDAILEARDQLGTVRQALRGFSDRTRQILLLRRLEQLSVRETADRVRISKSTVEKSLAGATRELRCALDIHACQP